MPTDMSFITLLAVATITGEDDSATAVTIGVWEYDGITGVATTAVMTGAVEEGATVAAGDTGANVLETFVAWNELYRPDSPVLDLHAP
mmetsp:Transcript_29864/g.44916  ORF Transcript_29864/g.44916 Transcript_29864/m.44916 type:complete len:88 (+) Transcript_29864:133-396(+)